MKLDGRVKVSEIQLTSSCYIGLDMNIDVHRKRNEQPRFINFTRKNIKVYYGLVNINTTIFIKDLCVVQIHMTMM
jgi:hypothetical protein